LSREFGPCEGGSHGPVIFRSDVNYRRTERAFSKL